MAGAVAPNDDGVSLKLGYEDLFDGGREGKRAKE